MVKANSRCAFLRAPPKSNFHIHVKLCPFPQRDSFTLGAGNVSMPRFKVGEVVEFLLTFVPETVNTLITALERKKGGRKRCCRTDQVRVRWKEGFPVAL